MRLRAFAFLDTSHSIGPRQKRKSYKINRGTVQVPANEPENIDLSR